MMERPEPLPMELLKSAWQTRKKFPSIHSQRSSSDMAPPGPMAPGFMSPVSDQEPTKYSSFLSSGAGVGGPCWANAAAASTNHPAKIVIMGFIYASYALQIADLRLRIAKTLIRRHLRPGASGSQSPLWGL